MIKNAEPCAIMFGMKINDINKLPNMSRAAKQFTVTLNLKTKEILIMLM